MSLTSGGVHLGESGAANPGRTSPAWADPLCKTNFRTKSARSVTPLGLSTVWTRRRALAVDRIFPPRFVYPATWDRVGFSPPGDNARGMWGYAKGADDVPPVVDHGAPRRPL